MALSKPQPDPFDTANTVAVPYSRIVSLNIDLFGKTATFVVWTWKSQVGYQAGRPPIRTDSYTVYPQASRTADGDALPSFADHVTSNQAAYSQLQTYLYGLLKGFAKWQGASDV